MALSMGWQSEPLLAFPCVGDGTERSLGVGAREKALRERELGGRISRSSTAWRSLRCCVQKWSGAGLWAGALERLQRSKNFANESCAAASANVAGIALPVTSRVGPTGTCELTELSGDWRLGTEPEGAVPFDCVRDKGCATDTDRHRQRHRQRDRETEREREREKTDRDRQRQTETDRDRQRERQAYNTENLDRETIQRHKTEKNRQQQDQTTPNKKNQTTALIKNKTRDQHKTRGRGKNGQADG